MAAVVRHSPRSPLWKWCPACKVCSAWRHVTLCRCSLNAFRDPSPLTNSHSLRPRSRRHGLPTAPQSSASWKISGNLDTGRGKPCSQSPRRLRTSPTDVSDAPSVLAIPYLDDDLSLVDLPRYATFTVLRGWVIVGVTPARDRRRP